MNQESELARQLAYHVYTFDLRPHLVAELVRGRRATFNGTQSALRAFASFLASLANADGQR